jgi:DNA polymerase (family 10)
MTNAQIADIFSRIADLLELEAANEFRVRAYRTAAMSIASFAPSLEEMIKAGQECPKLPGVGKDLAGKIAEIVETGKLAQLTELEREVPGGLIELMRLPGLGAKRVRLLNKELGITTFEELEKACRDEKIRTIRGLGEKIEKNILEQVQRKRGIEENVKLADAEAQAGPLMDYLRAVPGVKEVVAAGSFRRRKETVRDLDILVTGGRATVVMQQFASYPQVKKVIAKGNKKTSVVLQSGLQVDVRVVAELSYGAALVYFTGSKAHNIAIRKIGVRKKLKVNEYGVFSGKRRRAGQTEEQVYAAIGLRYIEPELREDRGEVDAAIEGRLPKLVHLQDIRGDLHVHTAASDGRNSLEEMVEAARARGYDYLAITEHTEHLTIAGGLGAAAMRKHFKQIDKLNSKLRGFTILRGAEVEILDDGRFDMSDDLLREMDVVVAAVHYKFSMPRDQQTRRILRAMENRYFQILAHPTGRQINQRSGYEVDIERIIKTAKERGCVLECNGQPNRLDLDDQHLRAAKNEGVRIVLSTDCHETKELGNMVYAVGQARRGWLEPKDVINTLKLTELRKVLNR